MTTCEAVSGRMIVQLKHIYLTCNKPTAFAT